jgi:hypothetical protein
VVPFLRVFHRVSVLPTEGIFSTEIRRQHQPARRGRHRLAAAGTAAIIVRRRTGDG